LFCIDEISKKKERKCCSVQVKLIIADIFYLSPCVILTPKPREGQMEQKYSKLPSLGVNPALAKIVRVWES